MVFYSDTKRLGGKTVAGDTATAAPILAVGEVSRWHQAGRRLPVDSQIAYVEFHEVTESLLEILAPDVILSPTLCASFDCLDLATLLNMLGFRGRYRAMSPNLPNPDLIRREVRQNAPNVDFDFILGADLPGNRFN